MHVFGANPKMPFRDPNMFAKGVVLTYKGGDTCIDPKNKTAPPQPRELQVIFECYDQPLTPVRQQVFEDVQCKYTVQIKDKNGCPDQCMPADNSHICGDSRGSHGLCGYDIGLSQAKCFCYNGWSGQFCTSYSAGSPIFPDAPVISYSNKVAGAFFGCLPLGAALVFAYFAYKAVNVRILGYFNTYVYSCIIIRL